MAEQQRVDRGSVQASRNKKGYKPGSHVASVDFNEMNFEQRRAPYNSGSRTIADKEFDEPRVENNPGHKHDAC